MNKIRFLKTHFVLKITSEEIRFYLNKIENVYENGEIFIIQNIVLYSRS